MVYLTHIYMYSIKTLSFCLLYVNVIWNVKCTFDKRMCHVFFMSAYLHFNIKSRSHRQNVAGAFLERWKKFITARNRSPPLNRSWAPLRHRRIRSATADGPSYRSESFELHKILRAVRSGQFSAPAKFTYAPTTPSQSLAPLDKSSRTLGSARPTQKSWTLNHRCFTSFARAVIKRCTNFRLAVVSVLWADTGLLERCRALKQRSTAVMNFGLVLIWRSYSGTRIWL